MLDLDSLSDEDLLFRPVPQSWNILEVLDHVKTTEAGTLIYIKKKLKYGGLKKLHWTAGLLLDTGLLLDPMKILSVS